AGPVSPSKPMSIAIALARPHPDAEAKYLHDLCEQASPSYLDFPTERAFAARFGVDRATFERTAAWLTGGGLEIVNVSGNRDYVVAAGTAGHGGRLSQTQRRRFVPPGPRRGAHRVAT